MALFSTEYLTSLCKAITENEVLCQPKLTNFERLKNMFPPIQAWTKEPQTKLMLSKMKEWTCDTRPQVHLIPLPKPATDKTLLRALVIQNLMMLAETLVSQPAWQSKRVLFVCLGDLELSELSQIDNPANTMFEMFYDTFKNLVFTNHQLTLFQFGKYSPDTNADSLMKNLAVKHNVDEFNLVYFFTPPTTSPELIDGLLAVLEQKTNFNSVFYAFIQH